MSITYIVSGRDNLKILATLTYFYRLFLQKGLIIHILQRIMSEKDRHINSSFTWTKNKIKYKRPKYIIAIAFIAKDDKLAFDFHDRIIDEVTESENSLLCEIQHCIQCCRAMLILPDTSVDEHIYPVWLLKWPITDELTSQYMADLIKSAFSKLKQRTSEATEDIDG